MNKLKKNYKKIIIICLFIYIAYIFINQQRALNLYTSNQNYYVEQIEMQKAHQDSLHVSTSNIDSKEHVESVAREKLDMYLPNERVYVDRGK